MNTSNNNAIVTEAIRLSSVQYNSAQHVQDAMTISQELLQTLRRVQTQADARQTPCYVVGGMLRDQLLGRLSARPNVDLAVAHGAVEFCRTLAAQLQSAFVPLDEAVGTARLVVETEAGRVEIDISDFRGPTLEEDLRHRDFTINAMALPLAAWLRAPDAPSDPIDPLHGREALARRMLIPCFPGTFQEDPVRILRAFRFAAQLEFQLEGSASALMTKAAAQLSRVASERIVEELLAIFQTDRSAPAVHELNQLGALDVLIPELSLGRGMEQGGFHHLDVLGHQLETVVQADRILSDCAEFSEPLREPMSRYCAQELSERHSRKALIKLSGLLHDIGKPARRTVEANGEIWFLGHEDTGAELAAMIVQRLRLSNREGEMVCKMVRHHLRPGFLSREPHITRRAIYRFFKDLGDDGPACLLVWWADRMATRGPKSHLDQVDQQRGKLEELLSAYFFRAAEVVKPARVLGGNQLMAALHLRPGPVVGELLSLIEEAQAEGRIHSAEEALTLAREHITATDK